MKAKKLSDKEYFQKIKQEADEIARETDMVGDTPTMQKVANETPSLFSCRECGLANADNESEPANPKIPPCNFCTRNPEAEVHITDFHSETWALNSDNEAIIEDPDSQEQRLMDILASIIVKEVAYS